MIPVILGCLMFASPIAAGAIFVACWITEFRKPRYTENNPFAQPVQDRPWRVLVDNEGFMHVGS